MVALVVNKDGIVYEEAFGLMDSANGNAMTTDAIFRLASMTKPVTSALIMMLAEEGKVDVDAPVGTYLPDLANPQVFTSFNREDGTYTAEPAKNAMTPRHLLTHTSGLGYTFTSEILVKLMTAPGARATSYPLLFEPGTQWHYGESTRVLGDIVEAVTGEELLAYMKARLLDPLGMNDTTYDVPADKNARVVSSSGCMADCRINANSTTLDSPCAGMTTEHLRDSRCANRLLRYAHAAASSA